MLALTMATALRDHRWLKKAFRKVTFSSTTAGSTQQRRKGQCCDIMPDIDCVIMKYNNVQCVCVWEGQHTNRACSLSMALCKPVSQSDLSMFKHTHFLKGISGALQALNPLLLHILCFCVVASLELFCLTTGRPSQQLPYSDPNPAAEIRQP